MDDAHATGHFLRTLAMAEARSAAEAWAEAAELWAGVVAANPVEGRFWSALAEARYETEQFAAAVAAYERALALGDGFPAETVFNMARCHAHRGDDAMALARLEQALHMGYRHLERAQTDRAFATLRDDPRYRELVGLIETDGLSRDEGWRADLRLLVRELKRRAYDPFRHISETDLDARFATLSERIPELTDQQVIVEVERLLRYLGDAHAYVTPDRDDERWRHALPIQVFLFEEGVFITAAAPDHAALLGAEILRLDDRPIAEVIAALDEILPRDNQNEQWPRHLMSRRLRELPVLHALGVASAPHRVTLTIRDPASEMRDVSLATDTGRPPTKAEHRFPYPMGWAFYPETLPGPMPLYLRNAFVPFWYTHLREEQTVYFQFNAVRDAEDESFTAFCERLFALIEAQAIERLVIDLRWNNGGNTYLEIQLLRRLIASRVNRRGRLFVIIGRATFSAAQNGAGMMDRYTDAIFVGEPTGSSPTFIGETVPFRLPNSKAEVNVSDLLWQSTWPTDYRTWIAPTLYTPPTFAAYRANRDPALVAILAWRDHLPGR